MKVDYPLVTVQERGEYQCQTALGHLILSTFFGEGAGGLMAFVTVYFDDSGTHKESSTAVAACYVSTVEQWKLFERDWKYIDNLEGFGTFHMADFAAGEEQFKNWTDEKRKRVLDRLCAIIRIRARMGFFIAVRKADYDKVITGRFRDYCGKYPTVLQYENAPASLDCGEKHMHPILQ